MYQGPIRFAAVDRDCRKVPSPDFVEPVSWMIVTAGVDVKGLIYYVHVPFLPDGATAADYWCLFEHALLTLQDVTERPELYGAGTDGISQINKVVYHGS